MTSEQVKSSKKIDFGLFTDQNKIKEEIRKAFCAFDLQSVLYYQEKLEELAGPSAQLSNEIDATKKMQRTIHKLGADDVYSIAQMFTDFENTNDQKSPLPRQAVMEGLARKIIKKCHSLYWDFIDPEKNLHPGEFIIYLKDYDLLLDACQTYLIEKGEHPLIRQYMSFYFFKKENYEEAPKHLSLALIINPFQLLPKYIPNQKIKEWLKGIQGADDDLFEEYLENFLQLWDQKELNIIQYDSVVNHIKEQLESFNPLSPKMQEKAVAFLNAFYLAECYRQSSSNPAALIDTRIILKDLYPKVYATYLHLIE